MRSPNGRVNARPGSRGTRRTILVHVIRCACTHRRGLAAALAIALALSACGERRNDPASNASGADAPPCDTTAIRGVVELFGASMKHVSLLAPDSVLACEMTTAYGPLITYRLLQEWIGNPLRAPARLASSPWPARVAIQSIEAAAGVCGVEADVLYLESPGMIHGGGGVRREPVTLTVEQNGGWRISGYKLAPDPDSGATSSSAASLVVRRYYDAIRAGQYGIAYALWSGSGEASGQTFEEFANGFANTEGVAVVTGVPGRMEGAAGSRYVEVPVTIHALTKDRIDQHFEGTYTLRRSEVDGATAEQRRWRIASASIRQR